MTPRSNKTPVFIPGCFVKLPGFLGLGKIKSIGNGEAVVSLFYSASRIESRTCSVATLARGYLGPETRAYVLGDGAPQIGRVKDYLTRDREDGLIVYQLQFPNGRFADFAECDIQVRCLAAPPDPGSILANGSASSQFFHDRRQAASRRLVATQAGAQGMTALLSSSIDFVPYQIAAIRRVLSDPLQRYLLADEVGMGKTIEAGIIIRQCLIDNPGHTVLVLAPDALVEQWEVELETKFRLADFPDAITVLPYDAAGGALVPDLLVVDEAHHVITDRNIKALAHSSEKLLLLSATPVLGDDLLFLSLLNLLDPDVNRLDELDSFRRKVSERQEFGRLLLGLQFDSPDFLLKLRLTEALDLFPSDGVVHELVFKTRSALSTDDRVTVQETCRSLQMHIADTYRIHQRVIRSRRVDATDGTFQPRKRDPDEIAKGHWSVVVEVDEDERIPSAVAAIEIWREASLLGFEGGDQDQGQVASLYVTLVNALANGLDSLYRIVPKVENDQGDVATELMKALDEIVAVEAEECAREDVAYASLLLLRKVIIADGHPNPKVVAFFSDLEIAERLLKKFKGTHEAILFSTDAIDPIERFEHDARAWVLITDATGEEGINLHFAHGILHGDLPFSAARIEQRIGRLDRFGRKVSGIRQRVILPYDEDDSLWVAWLRMLDEGFAIFDRSISDVQFILSDLEQELSIAAWTRGAVGIFEGIDRVKNRLIEERLRQDEQCALDSLALTDDPVEQFIEAIVNIDCDELEIQHDMEGWILDVMKLKKRSLESPTIDSFSLSWTKDTHVPKDPWQSEMGIDLQRPLTWSRALAARAPEVALLRQGTPLLDGSERYMRWDDRGAAFATWRVWPEWSKTDDILIAFKLCFIVEPALPFDEKSVVRGYSQGLMRRAQVFLPPWTHELFVDASGEVIADPRQLAILRLPYTKRISENGRYDRNLGNRLDWLFQVIDKERFEWLCDDIRTRSIGMIYNDQKFIDRTSAALSKATIDLDHREMRLARRLAAGTVTSAVAEMEQQLNDTIRSAVARPRVILDAMGLFIVAGAPPEFEE